MKKTTVVLFAIFTLLWCVTPANATLWDRGGGLIYDDDLDITWLQDANYAKASGYDNDGLMTWANAVAFADGLVYGGFNDWRLPSSDTCSGLNCTNSEMGHLFYLELGHVANGGYGGNLGIFTNEPPSNPSLSWAFWSGTRNTSYTSYPNAWIFEFDRGLQDFFNVQWDAYALIVRDGDVIASVPEPSTLFLLGSGLFGFVAFSRKCLALR